MSFAIVAEPLLGTYRGHVGSGQLDPLPAPARLHAALLCAAAQGVRAVADGDGLQPCDADREALRWLEANPPDGITVPETLRNGDDATAYRKEGLIVKEGRNPLADKLIGKPAVSGVALTGRFAWTWEQEPPPPVATALSELCPEVPYLGTSESPVRLAVAEAEPTHRLDPDADLFVGEGLDLSVASSGRAAALEAAHREQSVAPPVKADAHRSSEKTTPPPVVTTGLQLGRYTRPEPPPPPTPWTSVLLFPMERPVPPELRVRYAVAVHRALVSLVGDGAPAVLTGAYGEGATPPSNRCAIQFLGPEAPHVGGNALALLLPREASDIDLTLIRMAVQRLRQVKVGAGPFKVAPPVEIPADQFWPEPAEGTQRWWQTEPVAVPDSRPPRGGKWSLADAAALSVALVWRDEFTVSGRGDARYRALAAAAAGRGVRVESAVRVMGGDLGRYVHKVNPDTVIQPYRGVLHLGDLTGARTIAAIGQSRHLGGGLLVPRDLPVEIARRLTQ
ncbi:type I-U CRISPR-associated protein Cas5/Cas6 [Natronosporangium hydrolyticum]|uniref:Type I-U CRISPR-associated protein Cas5/Cas6 n=1 Tax=Natronosporangium hydrolyticum TaxID=2811111 RepID=A0A895YRW3_9ACTN|nr:type I-U CRISPR-associated protein Csb2 [Natronosporangium hydrolyticum]QSB16758.1 type I-U CRISPR-associated protein Cas5/Cas6 [Natronosporangium hydrolyticum]